MSRASVSRLDAPQPEEATTVLLVSPLEEDRWSLRQIFEHSKWRLVEAGDCAEALALLSGQAIAVVICERDLPDGDWRNLLARVLETPERPNVVVASRLADERLWSEVLNFCGYDVLPTPFDSGEVMRVAYLAWLSWKRERTDRLRKGPHADQAARCAEQVV